MILTSPEEIAFFIPLSPRVALLFAKPAYSFVLNKYLVSFFYLHPS